MSSIRGIEQIRHYTFRDTFGGHLSEKQNTEPLISKLQKYLLCKRLTEILLEKHPWRYCLTVQLTEANSLIFDCEYCNY